MLITHAIGKKGMFRIYLIVFRIVMINSSVSLYAGKAYVFVYNHVNVAC